MNLFWKIFVSFMIAMTITSVGAIYVTYQIVSRPLTQTEFEGRDGIIREVSAALARGGERELKLWLFNNPRPARGIVLLVTNERGDELLGRAMPRELRASVAHRDDVPSRRQAAELPADPADSDHHGPRRRGVSPAASSRARDDLRHPRVARHARCRALDRDRRCGRDVAAARSLRVVADRAAAEGQPLRSRPAPSKRASARRSRGAATRSERWRATSTRWPSAFKRWSRRRRPCCATSRTSCARRSRASAWRSRSRSGAPAKRRGRISRASSARPSASTRWSAKS